MTSLTLDRALEAEPTKCEEKEAMVINTENSRLFKKVEQRADLVGVNWIGTNIFISPISQLRSHESGLQLWSYHEQMLPSSIVVRVCAMYSKIIWV